LRSGVDDAEVIAVAFGGHGDGGVTAGRLDDSQTDLVRQRDGGLHRAVDHVEKLSCVTCGGHSE
jgi:hypothetical protein